MYNFDPRTQYSQMGGLHPHFGGNYSAAPTAPYFNSPVWPASVWSAPNYGGQHFVPSAPVPGYAPSANNETAFLLNRIEELRGQLLSLNELVRSDLMRRTLAENSYQGHIPTGTQGYSNGTIPFPFNRASNGFSTNEISPIRVRESDAHIYCDIFFPQLTLGDVEVEVAGNRIICRTRVPVAPISRWMPVTAQLPRAFDLFELPDGRVECSWICPVLFQAKEVEASFREGFLSICVTKAEVTPKHIVKVAKESTTRRASSDLNS